MNTTMDINNKLHNLELANNNFKSIIVKPNNEKFDYLDSWLLKTSEELKKENENRNKKIYPRFNYDTIVKVDFGINQGAELSGPHFAICMDKYDSAKSKTITVIPLTSKDNGKRLNLQKLIPDKCKAKIEIELKKAKKLLEYSTQTNNKKEINRINYEIEKINKIGKYYSKYKKNSYVIINQIKTISKDKIFRPINEYDIINREKCSDNIMNQISEEISQRFLKNGKNN